METMEAEEVQEHFSDVLREIEETGQTIDGSDKGRIVASLVPSQLTLAQLQQKPKRDPRIVIAELDALAAELSADLTEPIDVTQMISDMRR